MSAVTASATATGSLVPGPVSVPVSASAAPPGRNRVRIADRDTIIIQNINAPEETPNLSPSMAIRTNIDGDKRGDEGNDVDEDEGEDEEGSGDDEEEGGEEEEDDSFSLLGGLSNHSDVSYEQTTEDIEYIRFVRSIFQDEDDDGNINYDEEEDDDDDEYMPDDDAVLEDYDLEDLERVAKGEVRKLVTDCFEAIVDDGHPETSGGNHRIIDFGNYIDIDENDIEHDYLSDDSDDEQDVGSSNPNPQLLSDNNGVALPTCEYEAAEGVLSPSRRSSSAAAVGGSPVSVRSPTRIVKQILPGQDSRSLMSQLVTQIFNGASSSEVHVEGLPIDTIRKLVGRQMNMAAQLLLEMLLLSSDKSECFAKCFTHLMELSNQREKAVKKASFLGLNVQHVKSYHASRDAPPAGSSKGIANAKSGFSVAISKSADLSRPLTRSALVTLSKSKSKSLAIVDLPILADMSELFNKIDSARTSIKNCCIDHAAMLAQQEEDCDSSINANLNAGVSNKNGSLISKYHSFTGKGKGKGKAVASYGNNQGVSGNSSSSNSATRAAPSPADNIATTSAATAVSSDNYSHLNGVRNVILSENSNDSSASVFNSDREIQLTELTSEINHMLSALKMKVFSCLLPTPKYPLPRDVCRNFDPNTLMGRSMFTPAEDDLLVRGLLNVHRAGKHQTSTNSTNDHHKVKNGNQSGSKGELGSDDNASEGSSQHDTTDASAALDEDNIDWAQIRDRYLPSKTQQAIQFRLSQLTSVSNDPQGRYQRIFEFIRSSGDHRNAEWTPQEDIDLLLGFQAYGSKWQLIRIFYLPHRSISDLQERWKHWFLRTKVPSTNTQPSLPDDASSELSPETSNFLRHWLTLRRINNWADIAEKQLDKTLAASKANTRRKRSSNSISDATSSVAGPSAYDDPADEEMDVGYLDDTSDEENDDTGSGSGHSSGSGDPKSATEVPNDDGASLLDYTRQFLSAQQQSQLQMHSQPPNTATQGGVGYHATNVPISSRYAHSQLQPHLHPPGYLEHNQQHQHPPYLNNYPNNHPNAYSYPPHNHNRPPSTPHLDTISIDYSYQQEFGGISSKMAPQYHHLQHSQQDGQQHHYHPGIDGDVEVRQRYASASNKAPLPHITTLGISGTGGMGGMLSHAPAGYQQPSLISASAAGIGGGGPLHYQSQHDNSYHASNGHPSPSLIHHSHLQPHQQLQSQSQSQSHPGRNPYLMMNTTGILATLNAQLSAMPPPQSRQNQSRHPWHTALGAAAAAKKPRMGPTTQLLQMQPSQALLSSNSVSAHRQLPPSHQQYSGYPQHSPYLQPNAQSASYSHQRPAIFDDRSVLLDSNTTTGHSNIHGALAVAVTGSTNSSRPPIGATSQHGDHGTTFEETMDFEDSNFTRMLGEVIQHNPNQQNLGRRAVNNAAQQIQPAPTNGAVGSKGLFASVMSKAGRYAHSQN